MDIPILLRKQSNNPRIVITEYGSCHQQNADVLTLTHSCIVSSPSILQASSWLGVSVLLGRLAPLTKGWLARRLLGRLSLTYASLQGPSTPILLAG